MTTDLRDRLDDLLAEVPAHVRVAPTAAWRAGARRRVRRRLLTGAGVLAALALIGGGGIAVHRVTDPPPADGGESGSPTLSYPVRIENPLLRTGTVPRDGTAVSGIVQRSDGWYAVGPHGQVWRMTGEKDTDYLPAVSPDGSGLAHVRDIRDGGDLKKLLWLTDVRAGAQNQDWLLTSNPTPFALRPHTPLFWSPDSSRVLVPVVPGVGTGEPVAFLLTANGQKDFVTQQVQGRLLPAGWYDDHTLVWVRWHKDPESGTTVGSASVILTDLHGRVVERFPLRLGEVWTDPPDSSSVSVSPGGEILALGTDQGPDLSVWWFHLRGPSRGHVKAELARLPTQIRRDVPPRGATRSNSRERAIPTPSWRPRAAPRRSRPTPASASGAPCGPPTRSGGRPTAISQLGSSTTQERSGWAGPRGCPGTGARSRSAPRPGCSSPRQAWAGGSDGGAKGG
jgi:hypothetical protein